MSASVPGQFLWSCFKKKKGLVEAPDYKRFSMWKFLRPLSNKRTFRVWSMMVRPMFRLVLNVDMLEMTNQKLCSDRLLICHHVTYQWFPNLVVDSTALHTFNRSMVCVCERTGKLGKSDLFLFTERKWNM